MTPKRGLILRLPHGETDETKRYSMPDPDVMAERYADAHFRHYFAHVPLTDEQTATLLMMASAYLDLTTYALGQEHCVRKLRDIWRARRELAKEARGER